MDSNKEREKEMLNYPKETNIKLFDSNNLWVNRGTLGTVKCSESKWSIDFISFVLLVISITFFFYDQGKTNNYNQFIKTDLDGKYTPNPLIPLQPQAVPITLWLRILSLTIHSLFKGGHWMQQTKLSHKTASQHQEKNRVCAIVFKKHWRWTLLNADEGEKS